jgi:hypothetical protein
MFAALLLFAASTALGAENSKERTLQPEEDDHSSTPFTEYGEFNEEAEEAADTKFFQYGRFFGVSLGFGYQGIAGNRGLLYQGGFPAVDFKVHYWFDFNVALDLGIYTATHFFDIPSQGEHVDVRLLQAGLSIKYFFDTKNLTAAISFANPYLLVGFGSYTKTETSTLEEQTDPDTVVGLNAGGGLEFAVRPRKTYFQIEGRLHFPQFKDTFLGRFKGATGIEDLSGAFYTVVGSILFTW